MLPSVFNLNSAFSVGVQIAFDVHMADFQIDLISYSASEANQAELETDGLPNYEVVARSSPIKNLKENDDETFMRNLH